jgi:hypothetical protein
MKVLKPPQSGSQAGTTASRNRYGQYERTRAIPVNPATNAQRLVRGRMGLNSSAWRGLTDAQRAGWRDLGLMMVRMDSLGQSYSLQGNQAYAAVNNTRMLCGLASLADAPAIDSPLTIATMTLTLTNAAFSAAFTPTPTPANTYLIFYASPQRSSGRNFEKDLRFIQATAAAAASPTNLLSAYTAKFGAPVTGNKIFVAAVSARNGFLSAPLTIGQTVA